MGFGYLPEPLNAVDVGFAVHERVFLVPDPEVLVVANVHQPVVAFEAVGSRRPRWGPPCPG